METEINKKLETLEGKIDAIYVSVEKTRKYFFWTMVITLAVFIIPLIGLVLVIPSFLDSYSTALTGL
ncbi:MAG: hypothetical protein A2845_04225 [Candidatus Lloydbacteria bacterium RIFCSPHIGHO2_01_FULL_49_22]|uniref:Uncharacterized protein n=1 Tax=Candidatus Lloydbacteria bacterium RIFCSPHIGHO2_01_FULL_49_22 TaxID=1798658 RepID=A0A1G2CUI1_9BACT|nr:MAG: hypothetical protein A2845_04225 [Candidatus Lloydbacteria bacterium RIFCSPHIGHO2_01_FULL_49_22]OGZ08862.1 MAG: hypothetical protein A3C14_01260 [Candidatus Lloydbacteria bacterium RIFCSPHIGHO2_02_FULL_50_18]